MRRAPARGAGPGTGPGPCSGAGRKALQGRRRGGRVGVPREGRAAGRAAGGHGGRREAGPKARPGDALRCGPGTGPCALRRARQLNNRPEYRPKAHSTDWPLPYLIPIRAQSEGDPDNKSRRTARSPTEMAREPPVLRRRWPADRPCTRRWHRRRWLQKPAFFKDAKGVHCDLYCSMMRRFSSRERRFSSGERRAENGGSPAHPLSENRSFHNNLSGGPAGIKPFL